MKHSPVWQENAYVPQYSQLQHDIEVEIAIVGGGITGLTTAYLLSKLGLKIAVLESHKIASGVTGHTTGHLTTIPDNYYYHIISDFGIESAKTVFRATSEAKRFIEKLVQQENIDCDLKKVPAYYYAEDEMQLDRLDKELVAMQKIGVPAGEADFPLGFDVLKSVKVDNQAQFNAVKYLSGLARVIPNPANKIFEESHVEDIKKRNNHYLLKTKKASIIAKKVILATHSPSGFNLVQTEIAPYMSYVMAVELEHPIPEALFYDLKDPYTYIRTYKLNNKQLAIIGGFDHKTGQAKDETDHFRMLEQHIRERFAVKEIKYKWAAEVFTPADSLPYIGKSPHADNIYIATGYSGDGLIFGTIAGMMLADLSTNSPNAWQDLFKPSRIKPIAAGKEFIKENVNVAKRFVKDHFSSDVDDVEEIGINEGAIVNINGDKFAVYRDEEGQAHYLSPICTHLKCVVQWNNDHKSWDCPCHGSRFKATGEVMSGPAMKGLERKKVKV